VNCEQLTIIGSEVPDAGANALVPFSGFTISKAWERGYECACMASCKMFGAKSGRAKSLLALLLAPALCLQWLHALHVS